MRIVLTIVTGSTLASFVANRGVNPPEGRATSSGPRIFGSRSIRIRPVKPVFSDAEPATCRHSLRIFLHHANRERHRSLLSARQLSLLNRVPVLVPARGRQHLPVGQITAEGLFNNNSAMAP